MKQRKYSSKEIQKIEGKGEKGHKNTISRLQKDTLAKKVMVAATWSAGIYLLLDQLNKNNGGLLPNNDADNDEPNKKPDESPISPKSIIPSLFQIKNMTGKKITITDTSNRFDGINYNSEPADEQKKVLYNNDKKISEKGMLGYGGDCVLKGATIDPGEILSKTIKSQGIEQRQESVKSRYTINFKFDGSNTEYSVDFSPISITSFDDGLRYESKARYYIALPNYYKQGENGLWSLCISLYSPEVSVSELDKPTGWTEFISPDLSTNSLGWTEFISPDLSTNSFTETENLFQRSTTEDASSLLITGSRNFSIKNNTNSDITINNVQSYIERYVNDKQTPWQFINKRIDSGKEEKIKIQWKIKEKRGEFGYEGKALANYDQLLSDSEDKCLAFYYTKHGSSKNTFGNFVCGDLYPILGNPKQNIKETFLYDTLGVSIETSKNDVRITLYEPDQQVVGEDVKPMVQQPLLVV